MPASLRLDTALYASAILLDRLLGLLLLPLLARSIDRADYGAWTQTLVTAGLLMPLALFAFPTAIVRSFSGACSARRRRRFFHRMGALVLGLLVLCALLVLGFAGPVSALVYGGPAGQPLLPALLLVLAADAGAEFAVAWLRSLGRVGVVASVLALRSVLRYGVVVALVAGPARALVEWLDTYALLQCAASAAVLGATWRVLRTGPADDAPGDVPRLAELVAFSAPLVLLALFTSLNAYVDRFLLVRVLGLDGLAVYAAAVSLSNIPAVFYSVLGFTLFPVLARHWQARRLDEAARLTSLSLQVFLFLGLPVVLLLALAGPLLLPLLTTAEYRVDRAVFLLLGLAVTFFGLYQIMLYALLLDGRSRQVLLLALGAAALNAALNLLLAPRAGAAGAATAAAVSNAVMVGVAARLAGHALPWRFPWGRLWAVAWRAALAAAPLAACVATSVTVSGPMLAAVLALCGGLYFALDLKRPGSITRTLVPR